MRIWLQFKEHPISIVISDAVLAFLQDLGTSARSFMRETLSKFFWQRKFWPSEKSIFCWPFPESFCFFLENRPLKFDVLDPMKTAGSRKFLLYKKFFTKVCTQKITVESLQFLVFYCFKFFWLFIKVSCWIQRAISVNVIYFKTTQKFAWHRKLWHSKNSERDFSMSFLIFLLISFL